MSRDPLDYWSPPTWKPGLDHPRYAVVPGGGLRQWSGPWVGDEEANYYWNAASAHRRAEWLAKKHGQRSCALRDFVLSSGQAKGDARMVTSADFPSSSKG